MRVFFNRFLRWFFHTRFYYVLDTEIMYFFCFFRYLKDCICFFFRDRWYSIDCLYNLYTRKRKIYKFDDFEEPRPKE